MAINGAFVSSTLGMLSHAQALNNIGVNVANVTTGGYRKVDTHFSTIVSKSLQHESDLGGPRPNTINRIAGQGLLVGSNNDLDLAINGKGFFILEKPSGEIVYGRDGALQQLNGADATAQGIPLSDGTPVTLTIKEGFLADKNGYLVQGYAPDVNGVFPTTGALQSLRIDQFAFATSGVATTLAELDLNIPSSDPLALPQVDLATIAGTIEAGDTYSVTVDGTTVPYTVLGTEPDINAVRTALVAAINADPTVNALVTAAEGGGDGNVTLTAKALNASFTASATSANGGATLDNTASASTIQVAKIGEFTRTYDFEIFDSAFQRQSVQINFNRTAVNTWEISNTTSRTAVPQVDTVTIAGTLEPGDTYSVTANGSTLNYTVTGLEGSIDGVRDAIVTAINADAVLPSVVTAAAGGAGQLTLTAKTAGNPLTTVVSALNGGTTAAQVDTLTLAVGGADPGDQFTATVNGFPTTILLAGGEPLATVRANLIAAINANGLVNAAITAAPGGAPGEITLTSTAAGAPFTTATALPIDLGANNTLTAVTTTANATSTADNTASKATTSANVTNTVTTTPTTIIFDGNGQIATPATKTLNLNLTFAGGSTAAFALDISGITQFAGDFTPISYNKNGTSASDLRNITFDSEGQVVATFQNGTPRAIYKIALAVFSNPDGLDPRNGNVYAASDLSGTARVVSAGTDGFAQFLPNTHELSNVVLADEFTKMITTQHAYNSAATVFGTVDEMIQTARDLKR